MPNINFDIFYDTDTINITASRGTNAPRVKPTWKVRNAPKLPPRVPPQPPAARAFGPHASQPQAVSSAPPTPRGVPRKLELPSNPKKESTQSTSRQAPAPKQAPKKSEADKPKRKPRKLEVRSKKGEDTPAGTPSEKQFEAFSDKHSEHETETNDESQSNA